jgi:predicted regulator of Ras-like GTPase activity (Roadblock/LC7/MglB family)
MHNEATLNLAERVPITAKIAAFLKKLLGGRAANIARTATNPQPAASAGTAAGARVSGPQCGSAGAAPDPQNCTAAADWAASESGTCVATIPLSLKAIVAGLPADLQGTVRHAPGDGVRIEIPRDTIEKQLARGAVRITFAALRAAAPEGTFSRTKSHDQDAVLLPLAEILCQMKPARRTDQKRTEISADINAAFVRSGETRQAPGQLPGDESVPSEASHPERPQRVEGPREIAGGVDREPAGAVDCAPPPPCQWRFAANEPVRNTRARAGAPLPCGTIFVALPPGGRQSRGEGGHDVGAVAPARDLEFIPRDKSQHACPEPQDDTPMEPRAPAADRNASASGEVTFAIVAQDSASGPKPAISYQPSALSSPSINDQPSTIDFPSMPAPPLERADDTVEIPLAAIAPALPEPVKRELGWQNLSAGKLRVPLAELEPIMGRGRATLPWRQLRPWLHAPMPVSDGSDGPVEMPLAVVVPLFLAAKKPGVARKRVVVDASIPDVFSKGKTGPVAASARVPDALVAPERVTPAPVARPSEHQTPPLKLQLAPTGPIVISDEPAAPAHPPAAAVIASAPSAPTPAPAAAKLAHWTPNDIVSQACEYETVAGAVLATLDGLHVSGQAPGMNERTLAAFLPTMFAQIQAYTQLINLGQPDSVLVQVRDRHMHIFKAGKFYFAALSRPGQSLPATKLTKIAAQLEQTSN